MVTGQAIVLWSRLHLVVRGERGDRIIKWTKWMIIVDAICLHIPTTVLTFGSNADLPVFVEGYNVMEKLQMCGFFVQEVILSSIYIIETIKILKSSVQNNTRRLMYQLIGINVLIIIMDLGLLGLEAASLYIFETTFKGYLYSLKLKLEFAILSKLVTFVGGKGTDGTARENSIAYVDGNEIGPASLSDSTFEKPDASRPAQQTQPSNSSMLNTQHQSDPPFVDLSRTRTDYTHASPTDTQRGPSIRPGVTEEDWDLAQLEHAETLSSLGSRKRVGRSGDDNV
jgi:hypothetical protein